MWWGPYREAAAIASGCINTTYPSNSLLTTLVPDRGRGEPSRYHQSHPGFVLYATAKLAREGAKQNKKRGVHTFLRSHVVRSPLKRNDRKHWCRPNNQWCVFEDACDSIDKTKQHACIDDGGTNQWSGFFSRR